MIYNKLVRDKIPHIIQENGKRCEFRVLDDQEYKASLRAKLQEEMDECLSANENELVSELADLVEVVCAILKQNGVSQDEFEQTRLA